MESSIPSSYRRRPSHPYLLSLPHCHTAMGVHLHTLYCKRWTSIKDDWTDQPPGYSLGQHNLANGTNNNLTWHISFLLPLIDVCLCPSDHQSPLSCSHTKSVAFTIFPENFITFNFSKFYWQHDQWPLHHPDHHILYNLHSDKEQGGEECRKRTKFFLQIYCWTLRYWPGGLDLFCIYCIVVESV